ncbi:MAG: DUF4279 domain-containing protein [Planctomycetes bacterium]|jgi:hypothetical protein|nr:DUF4279 domain-containing protein [Planctomycetota bacterium]
MTTPENAGTYNDEYATCEKTYATLCIYPGERDPDEVTERLRVQPTSIQRRGEPFVVSSLRRCRLHAWFLCSQEYVESRDSRRHIDWILDRVEPARQALAALREGGARRYLSCYWLSAHGHGGPILSPQQMRRLADLDLECGYDIYAGPLALEEMEEA